MTPQQQRQRHRPIHQKSNHRKILIATRAQTLLPPIIPVIASSSSSVSSNVTSSISTTLPSNESNNDDAVPDSFVSSSSLPDFSRSSAANAPSYLPTSDTEAARKRDGNSGDNKHSSVRRCEWKRGDWC